MERNESRVPFGRNDYGKAFARAATEDPGVVPVLEWMRGLEPARFGECLSATEKGAVKAGRAFEMCARTAVAAALREVDDRGADFDDAFQDACVGLLRMAERVESGDASAWKQAGWMMRNEMLKGRLARGNACVVPRRLVDDVGEAAAVADLERRLAEGLGGPKEIPDPADAAIEDEENEVVLEAIATLRPNWRRILCESTGVGCDRRPIARVAADVGVSRGRASFVVKVARKRLAEELARRGVAVTADGDE